MGCLVPATRSSAPAVPAALTGRLDAPVSRARAGGGRHPACNGVARVVAMAPSALSRFRVRQWPLASPSRLATRRPSQEQASSGRTSAASRGEPAPACGEVAPSFLFAERRGRGPKVCLAPLFSPPPPAADLGTGVRAGSEGPSPRPSRPTPQSGSSVARAVRFRPRPLWPHPRVSWVEGGAGISPALPPRAARALVSGARRPAGCGGLPLS